MPRRDMNYRNDPPSGKLPADATRDQIKTEFARRLQAELNHFGWTQADLVNAAKRHVPEGRTIEAYDVSNYIRGRSLPTHYKLKAIAEALGKKEDELLPSRGTPEVQRTVSPLEMRQQEDGNVWLKLNRAVSYPTALKIMALLSEEDDVVRRDADRHGRPELGPTNIRKPDSDHLLRIAGIRDAVPEAHREPDESED